MNNYWGYNSLAFFAPHAAYLASGHINEFRKWSRTCTTPAWS